MSDQGPMHEEIGCGTFSNAPAPASAPEGTPTILGFATARAEMPDQITEIYSGFEVTTRDPRRVFGGTLRGLRRACDLTLGQAAIVLGCNVVSLSELERGGLVFVGAAGWHAAYRALLDDAGKRGAAPPTERP